MMAFFVQALMIYQSGDHTQIMLDKMLSLIALPYKMSLLCAIPLCNFILLQWFLPMDRNKLRLSTSNEKRNCTLACQYDIIIQNVQINHTNVFYNQYFFVLFFNSETNFSWISHKLRLLVWLHYERIYPIFNDLYIIGNLFKMCFCLLNTIFHNDILTTWWSSDIFSLTLVYNSRHLYTYSSSASFKWRMMISVPEIYNQLLMIFVAEYLMKYIANCFMGPTWSDITRKISQYLYSFEIFVKYL